MARVAVLILNWNGASKGLLRRYLPDVIANTPADRAEVIVVDNGSTDNSLQLLDEEFKSVSVMPLDKNYGFAEGYNRAIRQLSAPRIENRQSPKGYQFEATASDAPEFVVLLNDDVRVTEGWLDPMISYLDGHRDCAALQPKLLKDYRYSELDKLNHAQRQADTFEYAGACGGYLDKLCYPYCRGRIFDTVEEDHGQYDLPEGEVWPIMWATGACLVVRTDVYLKAGGLDHRFFAHMEEIDLCWRIRRMGYKIGCMTQSKVYHYGGASLPQSDPRKTKLNFRNSLVMMWKNLPSDVCSKMLTRRKMLDGLAAVNFLRQGKFKHFWAIYQAHREADKMIREDYTAAELVGFGQAEPFAQESVNIVWQYFKKGIRKFSDL